MQTIENHKLLASLVRSFFEAFACGIIDCHTHEPLSKLTPQDLKKTMLNHYEQIAPAFHNTLFFAIAHINYDYEEFEAKLRKAYPKAKSAEDLMLLACRTRQMHETMVAEYKRNFSLLLQGRLPTYTDTDAPQKPSANGQAKSTDTDKAIRLAVRTTMLAYARGIKTAATGKSSLRQATVYHLMISAVCSVLGRDIDFSGIRPGKSSLHDIFMQACGSQHNIDVMAAEMDATYGDLVKDEGIISHDDQAN